MRFLRRDQSAITYGRRPRTATRKERTDRNGVNLRSPSPCCSSRTINICSGRRASATDCARVPLSLPSRRRLPLPKCKHEKSSTNWPGPIRPKARFCIRHRCEAKARTGYIKGHFSNRAPRRGLALTNKLLSPLTFCNIDHQI